MTHAPEPLNEEYAYALSWKAATARLEAAGCIPVTEDERFREAQLAKDEGIEVGIRVLLLILLPFV